MHTGVDLAGLIAQAGRRLDARRALTGLRAGEGGLDAILKRLYQADEAALEAAGDWLFFPEAEDELFLLRQLANRAEGLMALALARPGPWCAEGLALVLPLAGAGALNRLGKLAGDHAWAREVLALLPSGLRLARGQSPAQRLARLELGRSGAARVTRLLKRRDWRALAQEGPAGLALAGELAGPVPGAEKGAPLAWPAGERALELLEQAARLTAREGQKASDLARRVSERTGRVVVLMGNASLGGPPLWAAPGPWEHAPDLAAAKLPAPPAGPVKALARERAIRLAAPALLRALWEARCAAWIAGRGMGRVRELAKKAAPWLGPDEIAGLMAGELDLAVAGFTLDAALAKAGRALELARSLERQAKGALGLIHGICALSAGRVKKGRPLVLPWADKFAASTGKAADHGWLAGLCKLMSGGKKRPLLLMIDETIHPGSASLSPLLQAAAQKAPGLSLCGLGCFAGRSEPRDLARALLEAAREADLVAFRVLPGPEAPTLCEALAGRGRGRGLNPASRDGAACLVAGTGLGPLADPEQDEAGGPPPLLLGSRGFCPVGRYLRRRVRELAGVSEPGAGRPFWRRYQKLCGLD